MLHACQHQKSNSTPEEICSDFRRLLRERATNHRQFYRHLSSVSTNDRLDVKPAKSSRQISSVTKTNYNDSHVGYKNKPNMVESITEEESIAYTSSSKSTIHPSNNDKTPVNHQPTILNVGKIQFSNDGQSTGLIYNDDIPLTSVVSTEDLDEELLNKHSQQATLPISVDSSNDSSFDPTPKRLACCANPQCPPLYCVSRASSSPSSSLGGTNFVNATVSDSHEDDIIIGSVAELDDDAGVARNHFSDDKSNDNKSSVSVLSIVASTQLPFSTSSSVIAPAINNNNKTCKRHDQNHSNYLTLVRAASLNGCSTTKFNDKCGNCDKIWYQSSASSAQSESDIRGTGKKEEPVKGSFHQEDTCIVGSGCEQELLGAGLCLGNRLKKFESDSFISKRECESDECVKTVESRVDNRCKCSSREDLMNSSSLSNSSSDDDNSEFLRSFSLLIDTAALQGYPELNRAFFENPKDSSYLSESNQQYYNFPCVDKLVKMYTKLLQDKKTEMKSSDAMAAESQTKSSSSGGGDSPANCDTKLIEGLQIKDDRAADMNRSSPISDEGCQMASSPYSSDVEDNENESVGATDGTKRKEKVLRSSSSDSALDLDDEPPMEPPPNMNTGRRLTLTVTDIPLRAALLPVAEPNTLPDSMVPIDPTPTPTAPQTSVPSKVILEERIVEIPEDKFVSNSRRESAQSTLSDFNPIECGAVRIVRTPSVVVSDYSDDILCGVTLEEIEYFRAHRMRRRSSADTNHTERDDAASDVSAASSCSNLDYCGSTISGLDGTEYYMNGERMLIDRKISDCSTCSTVSGDDDDVENSNSSAGVGSGFILQDTEDITDEQLQQKENELQRLQKQRKKIQVKARHPKFIN